MSDSNPFYSKIDKLAGGYIPRSMAERLALVAVYKNTTRTDLIKKAVESILSDQPDNNELIQKIAQMALDSRNGEEDWDAFLNSVINNLTKRRLSLTLINSILDEIERRQRINEY